MKNVLNINLESIKLTVCEVSSEKFILATYMDLDDEITVLDINSINDTIRYIPRDYIDMINISNMDYCKLSDNMIVKTNKIYSKIFFYDNIHDLINKLAANYIRENYSLIVSQNRHPEDYFKILKGIYVDFESGDVIFDIVSDYDVTAIPYSVKELNAILDMDKLRDSFTNTHAYTVDKIYINTFRKVSDTNQLENSTLVINTYDDYAPTCDVFNNEIWNGDFNNFIK